MNQVALDLGRKVFRAANDEYSDLSSYKRVVLQKDAVVGLSHDQ
jgi:hypothetical protein